MVGNIGLHLKKEKNSAHLVVLENVIIFNTTYVVVSIKIFSILAKFEIWKKMHCFCFSISNLVYLVVCWVESPW